MESSGGNIRDSGGAVMDDSAFEAAKKLAKLAHKRRDGGNGQFDTVASCMAVVDSMRSVPGTAMRKVDMRSSAHRRVQQSELMKRYFSDPANRARRSEYSRKYFSDPANRARHSEFMRKYFSDPENLARHSELSRRNIAKAAVKLAGLPLLRRHVDEARRLLDEGHTIKATAEKLGDYKES